MPDLVLRFTFPVHRLEHRARHAIRFHLDRFEGERASAECPSTDQIISLGNQIVYLFGWLLRCQAPNYSIMDISVYHIKNA